MNVAACDDRTRRLLEDDRFAELHLRSSRQPLLWNEFLGMAMPSGYSHAEVWEVLALIRRQGGIDFAVPYYNDPRAVPAWYSLTHRDHAVLRRIESLARKDSSLHRALAERAGRHFVIQPMIEEAIATAQHDGLHIDYEIASEVLRGERSPRTPIERLVYNNHQMLCDLPAFAEMDMTPDLLHALHERLVSGVPLGHLSCRPRPLPVVNPFGPDPARTIAFACALADGSAADPVQHPVVTAACIRHVFWDFQPLASWNSMIGSMASRLYLMRTGYPVLQHVPVSRTLIGWEDGIVRPPAVLCTYEESRIECGSSVDTTPHVSLILQMVLTELEAMEHAIEIIQVRDEYLRSMLSHDRSVNHRQRTILDQALRMPDREFTIGAHRRMCDVAYATARADLLGLVEHGFFRMEQRDRAFIFRACPDLKTLIERYALAPGPGTRA